MKKIKAPRTKCVGCKHWVNDDVAVDGMCPACHIKSTAVWVWTATGRTKSGNIAKMVITGTHNESKRTVKIYWELGMGWRADVRESPYFPQVKGYEAAAAWVEQQDIARLTSLAGFEDVPVLGVPDVFPTEEQMEIEDKLNAPLV